LVVGCGGGGFVPRGDGGTKDLSVFGNHDGGHPIDLSGPNMTDGGGGPGAPCNTACDCEAGLGCVNQVCTVEIMAVYCCTSKTCPQGAQCQDPNGNDSVCGGGGGPDFSTNLPDASSNFPDANVSFDFGLPGLDGGVNICMFVGCMSDVECQQFGCAKCKNAVCSM
jgi:hypothetical protein